MRTPKRDGSVTDPARSLAVSAEARACSSDTYMKSVRLAHARVLGEVNPKLELGDRRGLGKVLHADLRGACHRGWYQQLAAATSI